MCVCVCDVVCRYECVARARATPSSPSLYTHHHHDHHDHHDGDDGDDGDDSDDDNKQHQRSNIATYMLQFFLETFWRSNSHTTWRFLFTSGSAHVMAASIA